MFCNKKLLMSIPLFISQIHDRTFIFAKFQYIFPVNLLCGYRYLHIHVFTFVQTDMLSLVASSYLLLLLQLSTDAAYVQDMTGNVPDASGASDGMVATDGYTCTWTSCTDGSANYRLNIECTDSKNVNL